MPCSLFSFLYRVSFFKFTCSLVIIRVFSFFVLHCMFSILYSNKSIWKGFKSTHILKNSNFSGIRRAILVLCGPTILHENFRCFLIFSLRTDLFSHPYYSYYPSVLTQSKFFNDILNCSPVNISNWNFIYGHNFCLDSYSLTIDLQFYKWFPWIRLSARSETTL